MKRNVFRLLAACLFLVSIAAFAQSVSAQGKGGGGGPPPPPPPPPPVPFNYCLEYKQMPSGTTGLHLWNVTELNGGIVAVGTYQIGGIFHGFIYDHQNNLFTDVTDFFGFNVSCIAISSTGIVLGRMSDASGTRRICWFDYPLANPPKLYILDEQFPIIGTMTEQRAVDMNVHGDILAYCITDTATAFSFVANPFLSSLVEFDMQEPLAISDSGFVVGADPDPAAGTQYRAARWHPSPLIGKKLFLDVKMNSTGDVNFYGEFGAVIPPGATGGSGRPCRIGNQIDWIGDTDIAYWVSSVNDSGDLAYMATVDRVEKSYFYHASQNQVFAIDDLVSDPFLKSNRQLGIFLTNRVSSLDLQTPVIIGEVDNATTNDHRIYFLFPEEAPTVLNYSTDTDLAIPDLGGPVFSPIAVAANFPICDLNVTVNINHQRAQDLDVFLIAPNGTRVHLFTDVGGNGQNFVGTTLDDEAATAITSGATPFTGSFRPEGSLGAVDGLSTLGLWKLEVTDDKALKTGMILSWSLTVETP